MTISSRAFGGNFKEIEISLNSLEFTPSIFFVFGGKQSLEQLASSRILERFTPSTIAVGCTSAGEICGVDVFDERLVVAALRFEHTEVRAETVEILHASQSHELGAQLGRKLNATHLCHVIVICDGLLVNGSGIVDGLCSTLPREVGITGGLAADGDRFQTTSVYYNGALAPGRIVAIGLYGKKLKVGYGSLGGWDPFGPERIITKAVGNKLFELDGRSVLGLYKEYLGEYASQLPGAALRFPLTIKVDGLEPLVRTVLDVSEGEQSITFAGDIPQGRIARFMKANLERLVDGAAQAAGIASLELTAGVDFALLISCVGRRLVLKQRIEEELEAAREQLGEQSTIFGFYSYGEIAPFMKHAKCELHNQTMTITAFKEEE